MEAPTYPSPTRKDGPQPLPSEAIDGEQAYLRPESGQKAPSPGAGQEASFPALDQKAFTFKQVLKGSAFFLSLVGIVICIHAFDLADAMNERWADAHLRNHGSQGVLLYLGLTAVLSAVGCPRQALAAVGGYAFGAFLGSVWCSTGLIIGCACGFAYARVLGRSILQRRFGKSILRLDAFLSHRPFVMSMAIRLLPVGSNALTTMAAGVTSIRPFGFIAGSAVGYLPQTVIFALLGSGIRVNPEVRVIVSALLFIFSSWLGYRLYRSFASA